MRRCSWFLSVLTHTGMLVLLLYSPLGNLGLFSGVQEIYTIDLVSPPPQPPPVPDQKQPGQSPDPEPAVEPQPHVPAQPEPASTPPPPPATSAPELPEQPSPTKTPAASPAGTPVVSPPAVPSGMTAISAVKRGSSATPEPENARPQTRAKVVLKQGIQLQFGDSNETVVIKEGGETRTLRMLAVRDYTIEEYSGHYVVNNGWFMSVIDGREVYGGMLFYDSGTGLYRKLNKFGGMIYTYGPKFRAQEPIDGSITFLTTKEGVSNKDVLWYSRIMWMPEGSTATFGTRIYFSEDMVRFKSGYYYLTGLLIVPPAPTPAPAVIWYAGKTCIPLHLAAGFGRMLARHGIAVLILQPPGCGQSSNEWWDRTDGEQSEDLLAASEFLRQQETIATDKIGIWGFDKGDATALQAAAKGDYAFLILSHTATLDTPSVRPATTKQVASTDIPTLLMFAGNDPETIARDYLQPFKNATESGTATVRLFETASSGAFPGLKTPVNEPWIYRFSPLLMKAAGQWIQTHASR